MKINVLMQRWGLFAATTFVLIGMMLANLNAGPVGDHDTSIRYAFWMATAAATFLSWWLSQWLVLSGRERLSRRLLILSSLLSTILFVPWSLAIDLLFGMPDESPFQLSEIVEEWLVSAVPVFSSCMIASLPALLSTADPPPSRVIAVESEEEPAINAATELLPVGVRGGILRATADLQYVHLHSPEGMTTVPGPMRRVTDRLADEGIEVRRGEWIADRHVKQLKSVRGRWVILLKDGQQVTVSRRRLAEVKNRWGSTRYE